MGRDKKKKRKHSSSKHRRNRDDNSDSESESSSSEESDSSESEESTSESDSNERFSSHRKRVSSHKHKKKRRHSSSSVKGKKEKKQKRKEKEKIGKSRSGTIVPLSERDYFLKSSEFRAWLADERGVYFSDLTSEQSRKLFNNKFVAKWNSGRLKKKYYEGIESSALGHSTQTKYQWKLTSEEGGRRSIGGSVSDQVASWTAGGGEDDKPKRLLGPSPKPTDTDPGYGRASDQAIGPFLPTTATGQGLDPFEAEERRQEESQRVRTERREWRKHHEMVMDELLPKATGREARVEKKKIRAEQRRNRDTSPDMSESSLMGSSRSVQDRIQAIQAQRHSRAQKAAQKVMDYRARENARVQAILEMAKANKKEGSLWS